MNKKSSSEGKFGPLHKHDTRVRNVPGAWHNRTSEVMRQIHENLWVIERGYVNGGLDAGAKTTIIRVPDGRLFVHSPLPIDARIKAAVDGLGTVSAVVAPNDHHLSFLVHWKKHYPNAAFLSPPGLKAKRQDIPFSDELSSTNVPHPSYSDADNSIKQFYIGSFPAFNETLFFHVPSKTLLTTDIIMNFTNDVPLGTKIVNFVIHKIFKKLLKKFTLKENAAFQAALDAIENLGFTTLIPCHGDVATEGALDIFKRERVRSFA